MSGTNLGKMPILIVSLVIGIVMATTAIVPLVSDYSDAKTFTNDGYLRYTEIDNSESYTMAWDSTTPEKVTVNGEDYTIWKTGDGTRNVSILMIPDLGIVRYNHGTTAYASTQIIGIGSLSIGSSFTVKLENGTYTITNEANTSLTGSYSIAYSLYSEGEYILKNATDRAYLVSGSTIIADSNITAMGVTTVSAWNNGFQITGTLSDYEVEVFNPISNTFVISDIQDDKEEVNGYEDLYTLSKITFNVTDSSDSTIDVDATYSYFLVPYEVTADPDNPAAYKALVKVVPVMAFVALIAAAAFMIYSKRD